MAFPIVPVLLVGAGYWFLRSRKAAAQAGESSAQRSTPESEEFRRRKELTALLGGKRKKPKPQELPQQEAPQAQGFDACRDEGISDDFADDLRAAYESKNLTPADFAEIVKLLEGYKFPKATDCFKKLLEKRRDEMTAQIKADGGLRYTIKSGDTPSGVAKYYTGFPAKFKELGKLNENLLGKLKTIAGVSNYPGWLVGVEILIPADWKPLDKPFKIQATA